MGGHGGSALYVHVGIERHIAARLDRADIDFAATVIAVGNLGDQSDIAARLNQARNAARCRAYAGYRGGAWHCRHICYRGCVDIAARGAEPDIAIAGSRRDLRDVQIARGGVEVDSSNRGCIHASGRVDFKSVVSTGSSDRSAGYQVDIVRADIPVGAVRSRIGVIGGEGVQNRFRRDQVNVAASGGDVRCKDVVACRLADIDAVIGQRGKRSVGLGCRRA